MVSKTSTEELPHRMDPSGAMATPPPRDGGVSSPAGEWEALGGGAEPSWYLDPLVAAQKRRVHLELVGRWAKGRRYRRCLKTDLFEEANGKDQIYFDLPVETGFRAGMDYALSVVRKCVRRKEAGDISTVVADGRTLPFRTATFDLVISTSTLDHFASAGEFHQAVAELARILEPGGRLILTLDNPRNPLYRVLRWTSRWKRFPFLLGHTPNEREVRALLEELGLLVLGQEWLISNPRGISTVVFLAVRLLFRGGGDRVVSALLRVFEVGGALPPRRYSSCFHAALAEKPR